MKVYFQIQKHVNSLKAFIFFLRGDYFSCRNTICI